MEQSILTSTKKVLQIGPDDESFDLDIMTHINSAFSTLHDLGVGPIEGFVIEDETAEWNSFLENDPVQLSQVKTFVYLHSRMLFDPPTTSFVQTSIEKQLEEVVWRLNVRREGREWVDPNSLEPVEAPPVVVQPPVLDGGEI
jgi:hypothetical protein